MVSSIEKAGAHTHALKSQPIGMSAGMSPRQPPVLSDEPNGLWHTAHMQNMPWRASLNTWSVSVYGPRRTGMCQISRFHRERSLDSSGHVLRAPHVSAHQGRFFSWFKPETHPNSHIHTSTDLQTSHDLCLYLHWARKWHKNINATIFTPAAQNLRLCCSDWLCIYGYGFTACV